MTHFPPTVPLGAGELRAWLLQHVCPFWFERVFDPAGGFYEALDSTSNVVLAPERTVLNQACLTYVASHAYLLSADKKMLKAAEHGMAFLKLASVQSGPAAGWPKVLTSDGKAIDATRDAKDHAFIIFAMAWYFRATGDAEALIVAIQASVFMRKYLADAESGGYFDEYPATDKVPRSQSLHMHLLEAVLAMFEATNDKSWLRQAHQLVQLFREKLTDPLTGAVIEHFNKDWTPADGAAGALRVPGHQFEWVWLLGQYEILAGDNLTAPLTERLFAFGRRHGMDRAVKVGRAVLDGVDQNGAIVADTKQLWPQTEYIKACVQKYRDSHASKWLSAAETHTQLMRKHYFKSDAASWFSQLTRAGRGVASNTPSWMLYHIFLSMSELIDVKEKT